LKIAFIGQKGIPATFGGIEYHVDELSRGLAALGHDVRVYVRDWYTDRALRSYGGVRLIHIPTVRTKHLDASVHSLLCTLHAAGTGADIIHYHAIGPSLFSILPRLLGIKTVATVHRLDWDTEKWSEPAKIALKAGEWVSIRVPDRTIVVSEDLRRYFLKKYGRETIHISHGIHLPEKREAAVIGERYGLRNRGYVLFMGRLVPEKRVEWLIEAFRELKESPAAPEGLKLVIAGGTSATDAYVLSLKNLARDIPDIVFTGYVTGVVKDELLSNAMLFVLPSHLEGFPIVLLEAMGRGLCCLCSDISPHQEAIHDGVDGWLFRRADSSNFREKMNRLACDAELRRDLGEHALERMRKRPGWMDVVRQTESVYRSIRPETGRHRR